MKDYGKTVKFTPDDLIKETGSDLIAERNKFSVGCNLVHPYFFAKNAKNRRSSQNIL
jgi:hypothetical protein